MRRIADFFRALLYVIGISTMYSVPGVLLRLPEGGTGKVCLWMA